MKSTLKLFVQALLFDQFSCLYLNMMEYKTLGTSELRVSAVCLGTMTWGQQNTVDEGVSQMNLAFSEFGVNFLDTAEIYPIPPKPETQGATDRVISTWLKTQDRSKVVLASKVAGSGRMTWVRKNGENPRVRREDIIYSVDESLKRLNTDYIDLLQIHWPDRYVALFGADTYDVSQERESISFEEQLRGFEEVIKAGKVRYIGVSNETPYGVMKFTQAAEQFGLPRIVSIQNSYSLLVRSDFESSLVEVCSQRNENIGLLAYSPLAGGVLTGKYAKPDCPENVRLNLFQGYMARYRQSVAQDAVAAYCAIANKYELTPAELSLAWCYTRPHVSSTIIGATSLSQLKENLSAFNKRDKITPDVLTDIAAVYKRYRDPSRV